MSNRNLLKSLDKERLIDMLEDEAKNWLAHDGLWFLAVERHADMDTAIRLDTEAWEQFSPIEARRIMKRHGLAEGGGLETLAQALQLRMYAMINDQRMEREPDCLRLYVERCRVQHARERDGRPPFPCKPVGLVEYATFAATIDPRIRTRCLTCPPDERTGSHWCAWEFTLG